MLKRKYGHIPATVAAAVLLSTSATTLCHAGGLNLNVDIGVPAPPPPARVYVAPPPTPAQVILPATPPQFVYVPELGYYVAMGIAYDMIYDGRDYYYNNNGYWYRTSYYGGPWQHVGAKLLPQILVRHNIKEMHRFRDVEFRRYEHDRGHYKGQLHRPGVRKEERREERHDERHEERDRR